MAGQPSYNKPYVLYRCMEQIHSIILSNLPDPPVYPTAHLSAALPSDGVDRISRLSDALLRNIVSRLPAKEAARTAALATRWRGVWRSTPLVLVDTHLFPNGAPAGSTDVTADVSRVLAAHPGPFRCVHLTRTDAHEGLLGHWLRLLAAGGVHELVLVNSPCRRDVRLPMRFFTISTLTRLYIGLWKFPDAAAVRGTFFPHLRELGICSVDVESGEIDAFVARSPALEILNIQGSMKGVRLRLVSKSLRCLQFIDFFLESVYIVQAPRLERLILSECLSAAGESRTIIIIGNVPNLNFFGNLEPGNYVLEIKETIMAEIKTNLSMMVTSVKTLSLKVRFGVHNDVKMVLGLLRSFPNVEALHIMSKKCDQPTSTVNLMVWEDIGTILSVALRLKVMIYRDYRAHEDELAFLWYIFENALVLNFVLVSTVNQRFTSLSLDEMSSTLRDMIAKMMLKDLIREFDLVINESCGPEGGEPWTFKQGVNLSDDNPLTAVMGLVDGYSKSIHSNRWFGPRMLKGKTEIEEGGTMMSKPRQQIYIILNDWELGFSIRKVDLDFDHVISRGHKAREGATCLPPGILRFRAQRESPVCFSGILGSKILIMQPKEESTPDMGGFCFDVHERSLSYIPRHSGQPRPIYILIGDKLFVIGSFSMELLDLQPLASPSSQLGALSWCKLPDAPFNSMFVISRAVLLDRKTILVSVDINPTTYSFDMAEDGGFKWETLGKWILPFHGLGYFHPELDSWVGLALYRGKPGRICSCNLASATFECCPEVKYSKEYLFTEDPTETHIGASLLYMGEHDKKFCLVECIVVSKEDGGPSNLGRKNMEPPHVHMFRLTSFSLKLDENGDLTIGDSRWVRYYKVPNKEVNELLFMWPQVFCL